MEIESISFTALFSALAACLAIGVKKPYLDWVERRKFRHFQILVRGRIIFEIDNIRNLVIGDYPIRTIVKSSDVIIATLIDAGFPPSEVPAICMQALQSTRSTFSGSLGKLSADFYSERFIDHVSEFFELDVQLDTNEPNH